MAKPTFPRWADTVENDATKVIAPTSGKQDIGWLQEMPPFQIFNWLLVKAYRVLKWAEAMIEKQEPMIIRSAANVTWNGSSISFTQPIEIHFRANVAGALRINRIAAGGSPIALNDGDCVVVRKDRTGASPVTLSLQGTYANLVAGQYAIVPQASLTLTNYEDEMILFRKNGTDLEIPALGIFYASGAIFNFGTPGTLGFLYNNVGSTNPWTINHNLGGPQFVQITGSANGLGTVVGADSVVVGANSTTINFAGNQAGSAILMRIP